LCDFVSGANFQVRDLRAIALSHLQCMLQQRRANAKATQFRTHGHVIDVQFFGDQARYDKTAELKPVND
jgi:hypothetical protein